MLACHSLDYLQNTSSTYYTMPQTEFGGMLALQNIQELRMKSPEDLHTAGNWKRNIVLTVTSQSNLLEAFHSKA